MKHSKHIIKLSIILLIVAFALSCSDDSLSIKISNWKILYHQDQSLKDVLKKSDWQPIEIPSTFKLPYPPVKDFQFVWLRGEFNIKDDPSNYYGLSTGRIRFTDKIFINNYLIGNLRPEKANWSPLPRNYIIPRGILKKGSNVMYIQLGIYGKYYGGILSDVLIQREEDFEHTEFFSDLIYKHLPFELLVIFGGFIAALLVVFLLNRNEKLPFYSLLGILVYLIYMLTLLSSNKVISYESYLAVLMSIIPFFSIAQLLFIQSIYRIFLTDHNRITIPMFLLFVVIMALFKDTEYNYQVGFMIANISLAISIPYLAYLIYRLNSINPDKFLRNMLILMYIIVCSIIIFEFYSKYTGGFYSDIVATSSPLIFLIIFAVLFYREILKRQIELEFLYKKLRRFGGYEKELSITDSSEEKLKRVIGFIDDNFTSDISREGLAAAVGINPNYMGTLFKTYTGKTINEYINNLRIKEATCKIAAGNSKIIDIAFSVGFENIVTFNRVFKKVTGKTPSEYKK